MIGYLEKLSIKSRLILMLLFVSLISSLIIGFLGWRNGQVALNEAILNKLTSVRAAKAHQIESYFETIYSQTRTMAEDRMIVNAIKQFREGYEVGVYRSLTDEENDAVTAYYNDVFIPKLSANFPDSVLPILYQPRRPVARYFQYHYLVNNPFPIGQKDELSASDGDTTIYNRFHQFYHPIFRNVLNEFDYYDIFLIDIETGNIVYSVFKEIDFATSLLEGPHRESGLGVLAQRIHDEPARGKVTVIDFRAYDPSYAAPAAFMGAPIFDGAEAVGILAIQISPNEINNVMMEGQKWREHGLGETGESYLVGPDYLMRSGSRFFVEDREGYFADLGAYGLSQNTLDMINNFDTTILLQPVATDSVKQGFNETEGTLRITGYRGIPVLSSYAPLNIEGLDWVIVSEIEQSEAFIPIFNLQRNIVIWSVVLILIVAFLAILLSKYFVRPIEKLTTGVKALSSGEGNAHIDITSDDEFGDLARNFNQMVDNIRAQRSMIEVKNAENDRLLLNILPMPIAERLRSGERIADQLQQVSVIYIHILGFSTLSKQIGAEQSADHLENMINMLDDAAEKHAVERVKTVGTTYIAACGLTTARLDHAKRTVHFAHDAIQIVSRLDLECEEALSIQIGIDSGPVLSGVVGATRFNFEMWGETVDMANRLHTEAEPNTVLVTENVYKRVNSHFDFKPHSPVIDHLVETTVYQLETEPSIYLLSSEVPAI